MDIGSAIRLLCEVHTRDDDRVGFTVEMGATPSHGPSHWHEDNYVEAWRALRRAIEMATEPEAKP